jgi:hypothetical protein
MANPIFNQFSGMGRFMEDFKKFKNEFQGDPKEEVEKLMKSGQMSQQQFNSLAQQANQIMAMFGAHR